MVFLKGIIYKVLSFALKEDNDLLFLMSLSRFFQSLVAFPKNCKMSTFLKSIFMLTALKPTPGWKHPRKDLSRQERSPRIL